MDDYFTPSQFVNELQSGQSQDDDFSGLDLDAIAAEYFGAEIPEDQVLEFADEFTNPQASGSSDASRVDRPQQEDLSNGQVQLPDDLDDLFEDQEPLLSPGDGFPRDQNLRGSNSQPSRSDSEQLHSERRTSVIDKSPNNGEPSRPEIAPADALSQDNQSHLDPLALGAANIQGIDQPADGLDDRGILPNFDWDVLASPEWKDFREHAADLELEEILGTDFLPATSVQHPGPSDVQGATTVMSPAANPPAAANREVVNDEDRDESDEGSEVNTPNQPYFETYEENDPLIHPDPPQRGWGQTGRRNGQELWFNPETSLWRKLHSFFSLDRFI